jgi:hypothetical protein
MKLYNLKDNTKITPTQKTVPPPPAFMTPAPATLQCEHTYCRKCLTDFIKTRPDAVRDKVIPCPLRCEGTKVPDPSKPVERWSQQIKPQLLVKVLMDKFKSKTGLLLNGQTHQTI